MKKLITLALIAAGLAYFGFLPFRANDVASLLPVETVIITRSGERYCVDIGEGVRAIGKTVAEALDILRERVSGVLFFQTAEQVIVQEQAAGAVREVVTETRFRPSAGLYLTQEAGLDAQAVSTYLKTHRTPLTLGRAAALLAEGKPLRPPVLTRAGGGYQIAA